MEGLIFGILRYIFCLQADGSEATKWASTDSVLVKVA